MDYLYETHMHTSEVSACATSTAAEQVWYYKNKGYTGIIVTDHFINGYSTCPRKLPWDEKMVHIVSGFAAAEKAGMECGLDVFLGWEFTVKGSDFLTYGLGLDFLLSHPFIDKMPVADYSALVRKCGGYLAQAHPYRQAPYIEYQLPVRHDLVDGIEVFNPFDTKESNEKAFAFAELHDLPMQAGTDSHNIRSPRYSGIKLRKKAEGIHDIINALRKKEVQLHI